MMHLDESNINWFCGIRNYDVQVFNSTSNDIIWSYADAIRNDCIANFLTTIPHIIFLFTAVVIISLLYPSGEKCSQKARVPVKYPGHTIRWILYYFFFLVLLNAVGEGVLSDLGNTSVSSQPFLYAPAVVSCLAGFASLLFYHHMECWDQVWMAFVLMAYWVLALAGEMLRFISMTVLHPEHLHLQNMRLLLIVLSTILYTMFLTIELFVIFTKVFTTYAEVSNSKDLKDPQMYYLQGYVNPLSACMYWWMNWLFQLGSGEVLELDDLGSLPRSLTAKYNKDRFEKALQEEQAAATKTGRTINLYRVYAKLHGKPIACAGLMKFIAGSLSFLIPLVLGALINSASAVENQEGVYQRGSMYLVSTTEYAKNGFVLVTFLFVLSVTKSLLVQFADYVVFVEYGLLMSELQTAVYDKTLRLSTFMISGGSMTTGQITNHMSVDAHRVCRSMYWVNCLWSIPYETVGCLIVLYLQLGATSLIGVALIFVTTLFQRPLSKILQSYSEKLMECGDERLKQINEMLQGIKLIKLYAWEDVFIKSIDKFREEEKYLRFKEKSWAILLDTVNRATPLVTTLLCFGLYHRISGQPLTPGVTFSSLTVFQQLFWPLIMVPGMITTMTNTVVSTNRFRDFFSASEVENKNRLESSEKPREDATLLCQKKVSNLPEKVNTKSLFVQSTGSLYLEPGTIKKELIQTHMKEAIDVKVSDANFSWNVDSQDPVLSDINLAIPSGKLTMIVGPVGSGKSSLISALLNEMTTLSGTVQWNSNVTGVAYAAQRPWLLNTTLRENILFGQPWNKERYERVIEATSLRSDIEMLPGGDLTEIGEKGINLSGGQKQRVSVARSMYSSNHVVFLDDPLSALDAHVGSHLFEKGVKNFLLKEGRTVILVTHQIQYLDSAHMVLVMSEGSIQHAGTPAAIEKADPELAENWRALVCQLNEGKSEGSKDYVKPRTNLLPNKDVRGCAEIGSKSEETRKIEGRLIKKEERKIGGTSFSVYWKYIKVFNPMLFLLCIGLNLLLNSVNVKTNFVLSEWTTEGVKTDSNSDILMQYLPAYATFTIAGIFLQAFQSMSTQFSSVRAACKIHNSLVQSVIRAPIRFFDTTPVGRIVDRFSRDTSKIDHDLGVVLNRVFFFLLRIVFAMVVNSVVLWYFVIAIIPVAILYLFIMKCFIPTKRCLERLESIHSSPIHSHFSESLGGLSTIRAYKSSNKFADEMMHRIDNKLVLFMYHHTTNCWLGARMVLVANLIVFVAANVSLIGVYNGNIPPSYIGLAITYALGISDQLCWLIHVVAYLDSVINSFERVSSYITMKSEKYDGTCKPESNWPTKGCIRFEGVKARYDRTLDPILHGINIHFQPGQKIGICGRTGSGKSTLTLALFRMIDMFEGKITIDGEDISQLPLTLLRQKVAIIPQDPVLFNGTIRFNLDPYNERTERELWKALEIAQLDKIVKDQSHGLDGDVTEGGENFSVGQRQLFCLARAFLRKTKILVMDEATASIDLETDAILQKVIATAFKDRTILTIAHRVSTILDSDKILTLDEGKVVEYDDPKSLLAKENSIFASLVHAKK